MTLFQLATHQRGLLQCPQDPRGLLVLWLHQSAQIPAMTKTPTVALSLRILEEQLNRRATLMTTPIPLVQ